MRIFIITIFGAFLTLSNAHASECRKINDIEIIDSKNLFGIKNIAAKYENKCFTESNLNSLMKELSSELIDSGYISSRPKIEKSSAGALVITINYGKIDKIIFKENHVVTNHFQNALGFSEGDILNMHAVDESVENIDRLPAFNTRAEISASTKLGKSNVIIDTEYTKKWGGNLGMDNNGLKSSGQNQLNGYGYISDIMGLHESWMLNFRRGFNDKIKDKQSDHIGFTFSVPYRFWLLTISGNKFKYDRKVVTPRIEAVRYNGLSFNKSVELERVILRNQHGKSSGGLLLSSKDSSNFIAGNKINVSSKKLKTATGRLTQMLKLWNGEITGTVKHTRSLESSQNDKFNYWNAEVNLYQPFQIKRRTFAWSATANAQYSQKSLVDTEEFSIGGAHSVRGFRNGSLNGESGYFVRNELTHQFDVPKVKSAQVFAGYDIGQITKNRLNSTQEHMLSGASVGVRANLEHINLQLSAERSLQHKTLQKNDMAVYFSMGAVF